MVVVSGLRVTLMRGYAARVLMKSAMPVKVAAPRKADDDGRAMTWDKEELQAHRLAKDTKSKSPACSALADS